MNRCLRAGLGMLALLAFATPALCKNRDLPPRCSVLTPGETAPWGPFQVLACTQNDETTYQFMHHGDNEASDSWSLPNDHRPPSIPQLWQGHLITVQVPQPDGGTLLIGNGAGGSMVVSAYHAAADTLDLSWDGDGFMVASKNEGRRRILPYGHDVEPGYFMVESQVCESSGADPYAQSLRLGVDTDGRVIDLTYEGITPAPGFSDLCEIELDRRHGRWNDDGQDGQVVNMTDAHGKAAGTLRISRPGDGLYQVAFEIAPGTICHARWRAPRQITMRSTADHAPSQCIAEFAESPHR